MRCATECAGQVCVDVLLAHPEVGELDVALFGQHHVVKLQVPVHNALAVQVQESQADLCVIETRSLFGKPTLLKYIYLARTGAQGVTICVRMSVCMSVCQVVKSIQS